MKDDNYTIRAPRVSSLVLSRSVVREATSWSSTWAPVDVVGIVDCESPPSLRAAATQIALYFRREFHYDFVQFSKDPAGSHGKDRAFLYSHGPWLGRLPMVARVPIVGCCSFRWREDGNSSGYGFQWAWFHPYFRRKGLLSRSWAFYRARFGDFDLEPPLSPAMASFLEKRKEEAITHE